MATTATTQWILELIDHVSAPMKKIQGITQGTTESLNGIEKKLGSFGKGQTQMFDTLQSKVPGLGDAVGALANPYAATATAVVALGTAAYKSVDWALDWQKGLAKINVTAQLSQKELDGVSSQLLKIGERNVSDISQIPDAFNKIISSGLDVATSMKVLEPTLQAAKAGFTDVETTAKAAVNVMNSSGEGINTVYDVLFATVNKGNAEFAEIANYLPKIIPIARNAGLALGETAGAWAFLTAQGQSSERATTLAENAMKALADPKRIKDFKEMGINLYDNHEKIKPLVDIVDLLAKKTKGLSDLGKAKFFGNLGMDMEAASFFATATQDAKKFKETIDFVTNSQGQLGEAYKNSMTPLDNFLEIWNYIKGELMNLGSMALPIIGSIGEKIKNTVNYFKKLYNESQMFRDIIAAAGKVFEWVFKLAWSKSIMLWNILRNLKEVIDVVVKKVFGIGGGIEAAYMKVRPYLIWIKTILGEIANIAFKIFTADFSGAFKAIKEFKMPSLDAIKGKQAEDIADREKAGKLEYLTNKFRELDGKTGKGAHDMRNSIIYRMEQIKSGASKDLFSDSQGLKIKTGELIKPPKEDKGDKPTLGGSGSQSGGIKNITQKIDIKNYFTVDSRTNMDAIAAHVVRAINDQLRNGIVAIE